MSGSEVETRQTPQAVAPGVPIADIDWPTLEFRNLGTDSEHQKPVKVMDGARFSIEKSKGD